MDETYQELLDFDDQEDMSQLECEVLAALNNGKGKIKFVLVSFDPQHLFSELH